MKQLSSTLILLVLALGIGGYIYFNERGPIAQEGATELLRTQPGQIQTISLESGANTVELRRDGETWYVSKVEKGKAGEAVLADSTAAKALEESLQLVESKATVEKTENLKEYGLDKPASKITVNGAVLAFGTKPTFDQASIYIKAGNIVALVPAILADNASKSFNDWRDKSLLHVKTEEVENFSLKTPLVTADFEKEDEKWRLVKPDAAADSGTVDSFLSTLSTTQSTAWLDEKGTDLAKWGLDKPQAVVTIGETTLKIGKKLSGGYAGQNSLSPAVFQVPETAFAQINRPLKDWRDKRVAAFAAAEITSVELTARGSTKNYSKKEDKWQEASGKNDEGVNTNVQDLLYTVSGWTAQDFIDKPAADKIYGFDAPLAVLKITGKDSYTLTIASKGNKTFVRDASGSLFELGPEAATGLKTPLDSLIPPKKS